MGKCIGCGRKGLFLKIGPDGLCDNCRAEQLRKERNEQLRQENETLERQIKNNTILLEKVNFYADTPREVEKNFHEAVDDYIDFCRETGKEAVR